MSTADHRITMTTWTVGPVEASSLSRLNGSAQAAKEMTKDAGQPDEWNRVKDRLREISDLRDDWDGQGATALPHELVASAAELAELLHREGMPSPSGIVPGINGTLLFEWQRAGIYVEAEITKPYRAEWMLMVPGQPTQHWVSR